MKRDLPTHAEAKNLAKALRKRLADDGVVLGQAFRFHPRPLRGCRKTPPKCRFDSRAMVRMWCRVRGKRTHPLLVFGFLNRIHQFRQRL